MIFLRARWREINLSQDPALSGLPRAGGAMSADFDSPLARARVVLKDATHAGNIGAGARAIKAMGITRLVLVAPKAEIDDSARARAKSAADVLAAARVTPDLPSALTGAHFVIAFTARRRELSPLEAGARAAARAAARRLREGREVALVFGGEQSGLGNDDLLLADIVARIDSDPTCSSLNLAQAAQIGAYELRQALREGGGLQRLTPPPVARASERGAQRRAARAFCRSVRAKRDVA